MFLVYRWLALQQCTETAPHNSNNNNNNSSSHYWSLCSGQFVGWQSFPFSALSSFFSGTYSISAKISIQDGFKMPTNQFVYLCTCQNHEGRVGPLAGGRSASGQGGLGLCPRVVQLQIPGLLQMPTSPDLLPPGLTLMADITCFWIQTSKDPSLGPLRPRHRAWISSIVKAGSVWSLEDLGFQILQSWVWAVAPLCACWGVGWFTELLCTSSASSVSRDLRPALQGLWVKMNVTSV